MKDVIVLSSKSLEYAIIEHSGSCPQIVKIESSGPRQDGQFQ